jgi:hypothetical protein
MTRDEAVLVRQGFEAIFNNSRSVDEESASSRFYQIRDICRDMDAHVRGMVTDA